MIRTFNNLQKSVISSPYACFSPPSVWAGLFFMLIVLNCEDLYQENRIT